VGRLASRKLAGRICLATLEPEKMEPQSFEELANRVCQPCREATAPCPPDFVARQLEFLPGWRLVQNGQRIRKDWKLSNFLEGLDFFRDVADVAEAIAHHPDLHLENYRDAWIEIWTHSIGGLSENDFILAAKIDQAAKKYAKTELS
jgi:4a-hydroxytetrahydrobiopterin dehydratase